MPFDLIDNKERKQTEALSGKKDRASSVESVSMQQSDRRPAQRSSAQVPSPKRHNPAQKKDKGRIKALDGLRAVAIIGVVLFHMRPSALEGGF